MTAFKIGDIVEHAAYPKHRSTHYVGVVTNIGGGGTLFISWVNTRTRDVVKDWATSTPDTDLLLYKQEDIPQVFYDVFPQYDNRDPKALLIRKINQLENAWETKQKEKQSLLAMKAARDAEVKTTLGSGLTGTSGALDAGITNLRWEHFPHTSQSAHRLLQEYTQAYIGSQQIWNTLVQAGLQPLPPGSNRTD